MQKTGRINTEVVVEKKNRDYDLQDRLRRYALLITEVVNSLPATRMGNYLADQLIRSGISPTLHYGEACAAESPRDFIHKMSIVLKELRESLASCILIQEMHVVNEELVTKAVKESNELVAIFVTSIKTTKSNNSIK